MLIGLVGFAGSGKGAVGDILDNAYHFQPLAFADNVKDAVAIIFDWPRELLEGDTPESREFREEIDPWWSDRLGKTVTPRYMLQLMGTEAGRGVFGHDIWVHSTLKRIENSTDIIDDWVITDVRFPNEIEAIKKSGGFVVRVTRGEEPEWYDLALKANKDESARSEMEKLGIHLSEWAWIGQEFDDVINNNGTLEELYEKVENLLHSLRKSDTMNTLK